MRHSMWQGMLLRTGGSVTAQKWIMQGIKYHELFIMQGIMYSEPVIIAKYTPDRWSKNVGSPVSDRGQW